MKKLNWTNNITKSFEKKVKPLHRQRKERDWRWYNLARRKRKHTPICERCNKRVCTQVHHIKPLSEGGAELDWNNLMSVCDECHMALHNNFKPIV